jgi:class 3 adenylate cyclase
VLAWEEAVRHWQAALESWGDEDVPLRASVLERLGDAMYSSGLDHDAGRDALEEALRLQIQLSDEMRAAKVHGRLGRALGGMPPIFTDIPTALEHFRKAEEIFTRAGERGPLGALLISLGSALYIAGRHEESLATCRRAVALAEELESDALRAASYMTLACTTQQLGLIAESAEVAETALEISTREGLGLIATLSATIAGSLRVLDPRSSLPLTERALARLRASQSPIQRSNLVVIHATALATAGRLEEARALLPDLLDYAMGEDQPRAYFDWDEAEKQLIPKLERMRAGGALGMVLAQECVLGWILRRKGDHEGAARCYLGLLALAEEQKDEWHTGWILADLAVLEASRGAFPDAERHVARLREILEGPEDWRGMSGQLAQAEGALAAARGDLVGATAAFERSLEIFVHYGVPFEEAETWFVWGTALQAAGQRSQALEKLDRALEIYRRIGASAQWLERALTVKMRAQGSESSNVKASIAIVAASVEAKRPSMSLAAGADGSVTLMFSDMHDYTGLMERLGDRKALDVVEAHNAIVRTHCEAHGGFEVELRGDGFLVAFPTPQSGVRCGIALQQAFAEYSRAHPEQPIAVRIGLHTGEAIRDADKFFGRTVIHAFRIADLAQSEEILVSGDVRSALSARSGFRFADERSVTLKGFSGEHPVARVEWG